MTNIQFGSPFRILSGSDIENAVKEEVLMIDPFQSSRAQPTSYDICIGQALNYRPGINDQSDLKGGNRVNFTNLELHPTQSVLFISEETFRFPYDMFAEIYLRSRYSRQLNCSSHLGRIECGWSGRLVLELTNQSLNRTVLFTQGTEVASLVIFQIDKPSDTFYSGLFQNWH